MKQLVVIGIGAVILAACSSGGDAAPSTLPSTTTAATSTVPATTVPISPPSPSTTTAVTTTTTTSSTLAPSTTTETSTEDLIKQAVQDYSIAYWACGEAPEQCDPTTFTAEDGRSRATLADLANQMASHGLHFGEDIRGSYLSTESVSLESPAKASVLACWYDAGVVLGPAGPDGNPTVVDDQVLSYRYSFSVYLEHGIWRVGEQNTVATLGKGDLCSAG